MLKQWLLLSSVAFGVGFGVSLPFNRDLKQSTFNGLVAVPASVVVLLLVRHRETGQKLSLFQAEIQTLEGGKQKLSTALSEDQTISKKLLETITAKQLELANLQATIHSQQEQYQATSANLTDLARQQGEQETAIATLSAELQTLKTFYQTTEQELQSSTTEQQRKATELSSLKNQIATQQQCKAELDIAVNQQQLFQQQLTTRIEQFQTEYRQLKAQMTVQITHRNTLQRALSTILSENTAVSTQIQQQITAKQSELALLESQQRERADQVGALTAMLQTLEVESYRERQALERTLLERQCHEAELAILQSHLSTQQRSKTELDTAVAQQQACQQRLIKTIESLQVEQRQLETQIVAQISHRETLSEVSAKSPFREQPRQAVVSVVKDSLPLIEVRESAKLLGHAKDIAATADELTLAVLLEMRTSNPESIRRSSNTVPESSSMLLNFVDTDSTEEFWQSKLLPYWSHRDLPQGQRFMGSFKIARSATDKLMEMVGDNLKRVGSLTEKRLHDRFGNTSDAWVKAVTLALSEYAYYYSDSNNGFWQGFCQRLNLSHTQDAEKTLRTIAEQGIDLLGLVRTKSGYRYVSTLWLQSGIPQKNLDQFAQLVQDLQANYGWEHLAEADHTVLSEILLDTCQTQHPGWGTLKNFLKSSCPINPNDDSDVDPISGQLVQGIAVVAQELERQDLPPNILLNAEDREALLASSYLPRNFFLRSWETLTQVITLRDSTSARRRLISLRPKRVFLELDLESLDTQLVLPEQTLWKPNWSRNLRGTYCQIPEAEWEETLPQEGGLEIPELVIPVETVSEQWHCTLLNHNRAELHQWSCSGTSSDVTCLVFDAITGEHIALKPSEPAIIGVSEILCFTPKETVIETDSGAELRDRGIPSSLRGWRGVHLERMISEATITLRQSPTAEPQLIQWKSRTVEPVMQGLRLPGKSPIYLELPTLWLPLMTQATTLNVLLENVTDKSVLLKQVEELPPNEMRSLPLHNSIQAPGHYEIKLWNTSYRWSHRFEVRDNYCITQPSARPFKVRYQNQDCTHLPIQVATSTQFWAANIQLLGLWAMDSMTLWLSNGQDEIDYSLRSDRTGNLEISLAQFYEFLPQSESYALSYQLSGQERQLLITIGQSAALVALPNPPAGKTPEIPKKDQPITHPRPQSVTSNWYRVTVRQRKRDVFCRQLEHRLKTNNVEVTGITTFQPCTATADYADYILVQVQEKAKARETLQGLDHFADMDRRPLADTEVNRMRGGA